MWNISNAITYVRFVKFCFVGLFLKLLSQGFVLLRFVKFFRSLLYILAFYFSNLLAARPQDLGSGRLKKNILCGS